MNDNQMNDSDLEALFETARIAAPEVPDTLMARVMTDAEQVQPSPPLWARISDALGGMRGLGGLVTATCVGVWLGVSPPAYVPDFAGQIMGVETADEDDWDAVGLTGFGWDAEEG